VEKGADRRRENLLTVNKVTILIPDKLDDARPRDLVLAVR
jgi:hypothetical protein